MSFFVEKYLWQFYGKMPANHVVRGQVCYKDTQMKAYDITKLTAELKSNDNVQHSNKIYYFVGDCGGRGYR